MDTIRHRVIVPLVRKGGVGKSTEAIVRGDWLNLRQIPWQGFDLDDEQQSFQTHHPTSVLEPIVSERREMQIAAIMEVADQRPVSVVDPKAHAFDALLRAIDDLTTEGDVAAHFQENGIRITVLLFPADDEARARDIDATVETLGSRVDYLLVDNVEKNRETLVAWRDCPLREALILEHNAREIALPSLWNEIRHLIGIVSEEAGKPLTFVEAAEKIDMLRRIYLERWIKDVFHQYDRVADVLLPDAEAAPILAKSRESQDVSVAKRKPKRFRFSNAKPQPSHAT